MTTRSNQRRWVLISIILMAAVSTSSAKVIYVDANAPGPTHDGSNWANAYNYLNDALSDAYSAAKPVEIRMAQGIYTPDSNSADPNGSGDRTTTFQLINDVNLKGGFAGYGQPDPNARDIELYESILTGDLQGNDIEVDPCDLFDEPTRADNSYIVVFANSTDVTCVLDGFTITACNGKFFFPPPLLVKAGGMCNLYADPTITNCKFSANAAFAGRSGMYNLESNPALFKCTFTNNYGSAMYNVESSPTVTNCKFTDNMADQGGGMANWDHSSPIVTNCTFSGNSASLRGGGMFNNSSSPELTNCIFSDNSAYDGGGMANWDYSSPSVTNCIFSRNWTEDSGGGMFNYYSSPALSNCIFTSNSSEWGGGMANYGSDPTLTNCTITGNTARAGGGMFNEGGGGSTLTNCIFSGNSAVYYGGGMFYSGSASTLMNCILWSNTPEEINFRGNTPVITYSDVQGGWPGLGNIDVDPCFAMPGFWDQNGTPEDANDDFWVDGDYYLKSQAGRWDPNSQSWVSDDVTSPCIDAGNPGCPEANEPAPNGNRINMGAYGGTVEASKSPANWRSIADMTNDWAVDNNDLKVFVSYWLQKGECLPSDFDRSRSVNFNDFAIFGRQ